VLLDAIFALVACCHCCLLLRLIAFGMLLLAAVAVGKMAAWRRVVHCLLPQLLDASVALAVCCLLLLLGAYDVAAVKQTVAACYCYH